MINKNLGPSIVIFAFIALMTTLGCGKESSNNHSQWELPSSWYQLPENQITQDSGSTTSSMMQSFDDSNNPQAEENLAPQVDKLFETNGEILDQTVNDNLAKDQNSSTKANRPSDWVPWHPEFFWAELGVSAQGILGGLILKGTPTVTTIWRRQYPLANPTPTPTSTSASASKPFEELSIPPTDSASASISVTGDTSIQDLEKQIDPLVAAAAATGKVKDKSTFKANVLSTVQDFQVLARALEGEHETKWWVSRFRMDFTFGASGKVTPTFTAEGEARFRIEWHRIMKKNSTSTKPVKMLAQNTALTSNLEKFIQNTAQDLEEVSFEPIQKFGYKPFSFRVGVGFAASGDVGIAKVSGSAVGQVYFSQDVAKPKVNPKTQKPVAKALNDSSSETVNLIGDLKSNDYRAYAHSKGIPYDVQSFDGGNNQRLEQIVFKVNRKNFRKGLKSAAKFGSFFAKRASKAHLGNWKIFELRTSFDTSISGTTALATVGGVATTEINFYNQDF